jgi:hypothetical protein
MTTIATIVAGSDTRVVTAKASSTTTVLAMATIRTARLAPVSLRAKKVRATLETMCRNGG